MNRTTAFLALAAGLLLVAVVVGLPRVNTTPTTVATPTPVPTPTPTPTPVPVPVPVPTPVGSTPGSLTLNGRLSHPYLSIGTSDVFASLEISAVDVPGAKRAPVNLAVVIDRSGSMSGSKIQNARRAANQLVDKLGPDDRLSIVHYGSDTDVFSGRFATDENKKAMHRFINAIVDEGGTNIGEGLVAGQRQILAMKSDFKVNRLLLLSDGNPTVGLTSPNQLANVVKTIRSNGVSVTSLGVGSDFNEDLMQRLADVGGGSYGFISDASAMATLFEKDLEQAGTMVAQGVGLRFEVPAGVHFVEVYGRSASQIGNTVTVSMPDFSARQVERLVVHFTASTQPNLGTLDIASFKLDYTDLLTEKPADARLSLSAMVTNDTKVAMQNRDKTAFVAATKAQASMNYQRAAEAIDRGDFEGAKKDLNQNEALFLDADAVAGRGAMADERQTNTGLFGLSTAAPAAPPEQRREAVKEMKMRSKKSAGYGASVY